MWQFRLGLDLKDLLFSFDSKKQENLEITTILWFVLFTLYINPISVYNINCVGSFTSKKIISCKHHQRIL